MKAGENHEAVLVDRPIGTIVNLGIGEKVMAFRLTRKLETVAVFPGGHGKSRYAMVCLQTWPMTIGEIIREDKS